MKTERMIIPNLKDCISLPDGSNLCGKLAEEGELRVMFLGGSITAGIAHTEGIVKRSYPVITEENLKKLLPHRDIVCKNLGYTTFSSAMGLMEYVRNEDFCPDIVFVEFAVNDTFDRNNAEIFESLVRRISGGKGNPSVVTVCCCREDMYTCEPYMREISDHYGHPTVSVKTALENFDWISFADDNIHPNTFGHALMGELINGLLLQAMNRNAAEGKYIMPEECCYGNSFERQEYYDNKALVLDGCEGFEKMSVCGGHWDGWCCKGSGYMRFTVQQEKHSGTAAMLFVTDSDSSYGKAEVLVNGRLVCVLDGYSIYGWGFPVCFGIKLDEGSNEITVRMRKGEKGKFVIAAFGI